MTEHQSIEAAPHEAAGARKPRIALMGEFSAGKSTLSNIMIGRPVIPMKVTATQLPPVWISWGDQDPWREDLEGNRHPVDLAHLEEVPLSDTVFIRIFLKAEVLEICDLIDTPGISDPNMPPEVWERAANVADGVIWLTHATQAWRQSEAAVWDSMPEDLWSRSLLLLTRSDKLVTERDRRRVISRVETETEGLFARVLPISLTEALDAGDDAGKWEHSGGAAFSEALLELITSIDSRLRLEGDHSAGRSISTTRPMPEHSSASDRAQRRALRRERKAAQAEARAEAEAEVEIGAGIETADAGTSEQTAATFGGDNVLHLSPRTAEPAAGPPQAGGGTGGPSEGSAVAVPRRVKAKGRRRERPARPE